MAGLVPQVLNWLVVGPLANNVVFERHRLERVEGKEYDEANVSDCLKNMSCPVQLTLSSLRMP